MKNTQQPSRRRLLSWAVALLVLGTAGIVPWQLIPRPVVAQGPTAGQPAEVRASNTAVEQEDRSRPNTDESPLLKFARAERKIAEGSLEQAEAEASMAAATRKFRRLELVRWRGLEAKRAVPHHVVEECEYQFQKAQASEDEAKAKINVGRARLDAAHAGVREVEARLDKRRLDHQDPPAPEDDRKEAQARHAAARIDLARAGRDAARYEVERAEANLKKTTAAVAYRTRESERHRRHPDQEAVDQHAVDQAEQALTEARHARQDSEDALELSRAELEAAEADLKATEADPNHHTPRHSLPG